MKTIAQRAVSEAIHGGRDNGDIQKPRWTAGIAVEVAIVIPAQVNSTKNDAKSGAVGSLKNEKSTKDNSGNNAPIKIISTAAKPHLLAVLAVVAYPMPATVIVPDSARRPFLTIATVKKREKKLLSSRKKAVINRRGRLAEV